MKFNEKMLEPSYQPIIGLEIHAELQTQSKMFCSCPVVDSTRAKPNIAVCPVCAGMPGTLPVLNERAVEFGVKVALALGCQVNPRSLFARKNYFYPDLPKGYQISQYEEPLARNGQVIIQTTQGAQQVRIRRVHLEEDTGKLTHFEDATLLDLNRAGVPLLEIVSEPDLHSAASARTYAESIRMILIYLGVNSGDMQKGVLRVEPNISLRKVDAHVLGIRTEIKNLNSFRALERSIDYEINRQTKILAEGGQVRQETVGWDETRQVTYTQRTKEEEQDYRYFPEPDLAPLSLETDYIEAIRAGIIELPREKQQRFQTLYGLNSYDAELLVSDRDMADYFEAVIAAAPGVFPKTIANWITGELFSILNQTSEKISNLKIQAAAFGELLTLIHNGVINPAMGKTVLAQMYESGETAEAIVTARGLRQVSDMDTITIMVRSVLESNPGKVDSYLGGKEGLLNWFFGQVMSTASGKANPDLVRESLIHQLTSLREQHK